MNKGYRQGQILKTIRAKHVRTQQDLARELHGSGIEVTQVTLSRDMRELGLVKTPEGYKQLGLAEQHPVHGPGLETIAAEFLIDIRQALQILVLKTPPGGAMPLARALDQAGWDTIAGTIAGDDTVMVVTADARAAGLVRQRLMKLVR